jgi:hypothetical protein
MDRYIVDTNRVRHCREGIVWKASGQGEGVKIYLHGKKNKKESQVM